MGCLQGRQSEGEHQRKKRERDSQESEWTCQASSKFSKISCVMHPIKRNCLIFSLLTFLPVIFLLIKSFMSHQVYNIRLKEDNSYIFL